MLAGLVGYMAVKQGGPFFNARAAEIRKGIDEAEKIKADSNAKIAAINSKLGRLDAEIASLARIRRHRTPGGGAAAEVRNTAEIERIRVHAEAEIETAGKSERVSAPTVCRATGAGPRRNQSTGAHESGHRRRFGASVCQRPRRRTT